jgi:serine/threonine protein kinase
VNSPPASAAQLIGQVLDGKYRLDAMIGRGGMGAVFRGHQLSMDRRIAVKVIHPELAADPAVSRRFAREARGTFKVESEHAIKVIDFAASQTPAPGLLYMVMEFLDGRTVARELDVDGPLAPRRALHVARQVAEALAAAHRIGIIHRDIKPDNIMLIRQGDDPDYAKVLDFGLAKLIENAPGDAGLSSAALTKHGMVFGTPDYMSPEQATGKELDVRSDVYALGATLFEMLTARPPFLGANAMAVLVQHVKLPPPHLADLSTSLAPHLELDLLVQRCLAKSPGARPATAMDLAHAIDQVEARLPSSDPRMQVSAGSTMVLPPRDGPSSHSTFLAPLTEEGEPPPEPATRTLMGTGWTDPGAMTPTASPVSGIAARLEPDLADDAPPDGASRPVRIRRWPLLAGLAAVVGGGLVVLAIKRGGATASRNGPGSGEALASAVERDDARPAAGAPDAAVPTMPMPDAAPARPAVDAARRPAPDEQAQAERERRRREIAAHLAAAENASNPLKQMAEAEAVLDLDPRNSRANYLFGDALIKSKDLTNGCSYLKRSRSKAARVRMAEAGCK